MKYNLRDLLSTEKPQGGNQEIWDEYVNSGEQKHFRYFNYVKTLSATALIAFAINLVMGAITDYFLHPKPLAQFDYVSFSIGVIVLIIVVLGLWMIDRVEELRVFREKEKAREHDERLRKEIREEIILAQQENCKDKPEE